MLLNEGLLPGGGVESGESENDAIVRELQEELGVSVKDIEAVGTVVQYRSFLGKKYVIHGYTALFDTEDGMTNPQDVGEARFVKKWLAVSDALTLVKRSIKAAESKAMDSDTNQGKVFNLMTTRELLEILR